MLVLSLATPAPILAAIFQGEAAPEKNSFWIYEAGYKRRFAGSNVRESTWLLTAELGYLKNVDSLNSFGAGVYLGFHDDGHSLAVRAKYRRWLSSHPTYSEEFSLGLIVLGHDNYIDLKLPGIVASATFNIHDLLAFTLQHEIVKYTLRPQFNYDYYWYLDIEQSGVRHSTYLGFQLGSYLGLAASVIITAAFAIAFASWNDPIL